MMLRNLTLHPQTEREVSLAALHGLTLKREPEGIEIDPDDSFDSAVAQLAGRLRQARSTGEAVLVGGHTGLWIAAALAVGTEELPAMFCFATRRMRDGSGRFVFLPEGLIQVHTPSM